MHRVCVIEEVHEGVWGTANGLRGYWLSMHYMYTFSDRCKARLARQAQVGSEGMVER